MGTATTDLSQHPRHRSTGPPRRPRARHERGASAVEYALLIAGIAAVLVVVILLLGGQVQMLFSETCDALSTSGTCA